MRFILVICVLASCRGEPEAKESPIPTKQSPDEVVQEIRDEGERDYADGVISGTLQALRSERRRRIDRIAGFEVSGDSVSLARSLRFLAEIDAKIAELESQLAKQMDAGLREDAGTVAP